MKASHTLEQRQAVGIEENLLAGPTSGSKSKLNGKILTLFLIISQNTLSIL